MTKILFVLALSAELKIVKKEIKKLNSKNFEFSFLESGMGNYNTIFNLTRYLEKNSDFDFIVNIGVCGYIDEYKKLIQVGRIKNFANLKEKIIPNFIDFAQIESIFCSEKIVYDTSSLPWGETERGIFVDMESYGFELVAEKYNLPRIILKVPIDRIGEETKNFDFKKAKKFLRENIDYEKLVLEIEKFLEDKKDNFFDEKQEKIKQKILDYYKWTFSEKLILEKELNKILALELGDLEKIFEENKKLEKKEFLKKIKSLD